MQTNISQSINAPALGNSLLSVENTMLNVATILASITTRETANMVSTASSHTPSNDKSSSQNPPKTSAESSITKTTALKVANAASPTIYDPNPASITLWESANFQTRNADFHIKRKWMFECLVFSTLWEEDVRTLLAKTTTTSITFTDTYLTKALSDYSNLIIITQKKSFIKCFIQIHAYLSFLTRIFFTKSSSLLKSLKSLDSFSAESISFLDL